MARLPRLTVPGYPHHLIQRGNDRQAVFLDDLDREFYLALLEEYSKRFKVAIHSYVLMDNHFHLLVTPETETGLPSMMQAIGRRYVQRFNLRHKRSGTLWEGRYRSTLIETDRYLLACMVYIDLNPVRAGMTSRALDHRWSSHAHHVGLKTDKLVTPHSLWWGLGNTPFAREAAYLKLIEDGLTVRQQTALTESVLKGWALGSVPFLDTLQRRTKRRLHQRVAGRPLLAKRAKASN